MQFILNNSRNKSVGDNLLVFIPVFAVFDMTHVIVSFTAMNQQNTEINSIKVGNKALKSAYHATTQANDPIASIVDFPSHDPKSRSQ